MSATYDLHSAAYFDDPYPTYERMRRDDPDRFDVTRNDSRHLGFGGGPHLCLGAALARLETKIAVRALLTRFPSMQLADDNLIWLPSIAIRGVQSLPVTI